MNHFLSGLTPTGWINAVIGAGLLWVFFRNGQNSGTQEIMQTDRLRIQQLKEENADMKQQLNDLKSQLDHMSGVLEQKDNELTRLTQIFQNRNPESEQVQTAAMNYMTNSLPILRAIAEKVGVSTK